MEIKGLPVRKVLLDEATSIRQEICLGVVVDRMASRSVLMTSSEGGVEIEEVHVLKLSEDDPQTDQVVLIGEIGGSDEEQAAQAIAERVSKPITALVAGRTAPPGRRMGHAGAIGEGGTGTAAEKIAALQTAGVKVAEHPEQIPDLVARN